MRKRNVDAVEVPAHMKLLLSVDEAAAMMSIGRNLVYDLVMRRQIASVKLGRSRRIPVAALQEFVARQLAEFGKGA